MISNGLILAAAEGANPLIPNPWEILVVVVGFALLMFIVIKFIVPTLEKSYQDRVEAIEGGLAKAEKAQACLLYTSPSPRDGLLSRMPSSA